MDRFSEYRIMWILVLFDLPTETKKDKKVPLDQQIRILEEYKEKEFTERWFYYVSIFYLCSSLCK